MVHKNIMKGIEHDLREFESMDIYNRDVQDMLLENDELTPEEAAFLQGYDEAG